MAARSEIEKNKKKTLAERERKKFEMIKKQPLNGSSFPGCTGDRAREKVVS